MYVLLIFLFLISKIESVTYCECGYRTILCCDEELFNGTFCFPYTIYQKDQLTLCCGNLIKCKKTPYEDEPDGECYSRSKINFMYI